MAAAREERARQPAETGAREWDRAVGAEAEAEGIQVAVEWSALAARAETKRTERCRRR